MRQKAFIVSHGALATRGPLGTLVPVEVEECAGGFGVWLPGEDRSEGWFPVSAIFFDPEEARAKARWLLERRIKSQRGIIARYEEELAGMLARYREVGGDPS